MTALRFLTGGRGGPSDIPSLPSRVLHWWSCANRVIQWSSHQLHGECKFPERMPNLQMASVLGQVQHQRWSCFCFRHLPWAIVFLRTSIFNWEARLPTRDICCLERSLVPSKLNMGVPQLKKQTTPPKKTTTTDVFSFFFHAVHNKHIPTISFTKLIWGIALRVTNIEDKHITFIRTLCTKFLSFDNRKLWIPCYGLHRP